jgi:hypothetical protein
LVCQLATLVHVGTPTVLTKPLKLDGGAPPDSVFCFAHCEPRTSPPCRRPRCHPPIAKLPVDSGGARTTWLSAAGAPALKLESPL